ncbi:hypothetical protein GCM10017044_10820 [Kordiimonas sediminis]|uniref:Uncharacterized protein n=1 Tax=Kordiimonas sediminis TaxID=1735581 RepID=A0A919AP94_9PROT|nr:hypothetical protein [Kordiimonas sediminis]GHF18142.1 hypothetical protein GCM10017044_10820 [Kordiimonas sediminis]
MPTALRDDSYDVKNYKASYSKPQPVCYDEDITEEFIEAVKALAAEENDPERKRIVVDGPAW